MDNLFRDGDHWIYIGDSLTQNGTYAAWVWLYYATRFPQLTLTVDSCGISGDSAGGALKRYEWDIAPKAATVATIMLGMNDVERHLYADETPTTEVLTAREKAIDVYCANMTQLAGKLQDDGVRVVFVTPSPFDDTGELEVVNLPGVNGALGRCAEFLKALAADIGATVIDLHGPLTALNLKLQTANPAATAIGPDRVHPGDAGHFALMHFFLKGQGAPSFVSEVEIDGRTGQIARIQNSSVTNLTLSESGLEFTSLEQALPYPLSEAVLPALEWIPFQEEFNREILRISGLSPHRTSLFIDDEKIGEFAAEELEAGLNLALFKNTPQNRQAAEVLELLQKWRPLVTTKLRGIAQAEHWHLKDWAHPIDFKDSQPELEAMLGTLDAEKDIYNIEAITRYLQIKPQLLQTQQEIQHLAAEIRAAAQPRPHRYRLERLSA